MSFCKLSLLQRVHLSSFSLRFFFSDFFLGGFFLLLSESLVGSSSIIDDGLESVEFVDGSESSAELFNCSFAVGEIVAAPHPGLFVGLESDELAKRVLSGNDEVSDDLVCLVLSHEDTNAASFLVLEELEVTSATLLEFSLSPSVELGSELFNHVFLFFASHNSHLLQFLHGLEVGCALSLGVEVLIDSVIVLLLFLGHFPLFV